MKQKTKEEIEQFFKLKQEALESLQPRPQMILNDQPLYPETEGEDLEDVKGHQKSTKNFVFRPLENL